MFSNLARLMIFSSIWRGKAHRFGMVFKREKNYMLQKDPPFDVPTSLNMIDIAKTLHGHSKKLLLLKKIKIYIQMKNLILLMDRWLRKQLRDFILL